MGALCQTLFHVEQRSVSVSVSAREGCEGGDSLGWQMFHVEQTSRMSPIWVQYRNGTGCNKNKKSVPANG